MDQCRLIRIRDVTTAWPVIRNAMALSFPASTPTNEETFANFQRSLVAEALTAWSIVRNNDVAGIVTLMEGHDTIADCKVLYVYSMFAGMHINDVGWASVLSELQHIARSFGCFKVVARVSNPRMLEVCRKFMTVTPFWLVEKEV